MSSVCCELEEVRGVKAAAGGIYAGTRALCDSSGTALRYHGRHRVQVRSIPPTRSKLLLTQHDLRLRGWSPQANESGPLSNRFEHTEQKVCSSEANN